VSSSESRFVCCPLDYVLNARWLSDQTGYEQSIRPDLITAAETLPDLLGNSGLSLTGLNYVRQHQQRQDLYHSASSVSFILSLSDNRASSSFSNRSLSLTSSYVLSRSSTVIAFLVNPFNPFPQNLPRFVCVVDFITCSSPISVLSEEDVTR